MEDIIYWLWLTNLSGVGSVKVSKLLEYFKSPEMIWQAGKSELQACIGINGHIMEKLSNKNLDAAKKILHDTQRLEIDIVTINDLRYPELLKRTYDPPGILYFKGKMPKADVVSVAVVGARKASIYGKNIAEKISSQLAERGICVVSGMARGIDTYSHKGALKAGGETVAILGCGIDIVYPKENEELMYYIIKNGAVVSEYPPGTFPSQCNFPARNRIISGITLGTIVVEAGERSGSLITADFALEQGREVFAVPGNIDNYYSIGTNNLIKQGAKLVTCIEDIFEELPINPVQYYHTNNIEEDNSLLHLGLSDDETIIFAHMSGTPLHIDELCRSVGFSVQKIYSILTLLEMKGLIQQIPGKYFAKVG
ncbi:MAG: DNA-processing protein DprA [Clostridia bacterium]